LAHVVGQRRGFAEGGPGAGRLADAFVALAQVQQGADGRVNAFALFELGAGVAEAVLLHQLYALIEQRLGGSFVVLRLRLGGVQQQSADRGKSHKASEASGTGHAQVFTPNTAALRACSRAQEWLSAEASDGRRSR
jgi:hypothetical protein